MTVYRFPSRKVHTAFYPELRTAENAKRIVKEIDYTERPDRLETVKHETKVKGNDTGVHSVAKDAYVGWRIMRRSEA